MHFEITIGTRGFYSARFVEGYVHEKHQRLAVVPGDETGTRRSLPAAVAPRSGLQAGGGAARSGNVYLLVGDRNAVFVTERGLDRCLPGTVAGIGRIGRNLDKKRT